MLNLGFMRSAKRSIFLAGYKKKREMKFISRLKTFWQSERLRERVIFSEVEPAAEVVLGLAVVLGEQIAAVRLERVRLAGLAAERVLQHR